MSNRINGTGVTSTGANIGIHQVLHSTRTEPQKLANAAEALVALHGLSINRAIHYGWRSGYSTSSSHSSISTIFLDSIYFFRPLKSLTLHGLELTINGQTLKLGNNSHGPQTSQNILYVYDAEKLHEALPPTGECIDLEIKGKLGNVLFISASCPVIVGTTSRISLFSAGLRRKHIGTVVLEVAHVSNAAWARQSEWGEKEMVAFANEFGKAFGREIVEAVDGAANGVSNGLSNGLSH